MMKYSHFLILAGIGLMIHTGCQPGRPQALFRRLDADRTGIHFENTITENARYNVIDFEYVYNGGGVAAADLNGDSLTDLFFTGNMVPNRLYLNEGNLKFREVTSEAGVNTTGKWSTGVTVADINQDGKLDIYVSCAMEYDPAARANLLYINQGNNAGGIPVFKDMAAHCGVADTGYSTQAVFVDYDRDQDLDLYVLTNQVEMILPNNYRAKVTDGSALNTDRLYRNEGLQPDGLPRFTDVSRAAGINTEGYGLGLSVVDINLDGWPDIYVTNDYLSNDLLWINQQDGTFRNEAATYFAHTSHSAMGHDVADMNNDALPDIIALDMLPISNERKKRMIPFNNYTKYVNNDKFGYEYQYLRNTLQLHNGFRQTDSGMRPVAFSEIGMMAGIHETDWSWTPLLIDLDNDGYRDLFITNGFPKDITDQDYAQYRANTSRLRTSKAEMLAQIPEARLPNVVFRNTGDLSFVDMTQAWGMDIPSFSNGATFADLDRDGDLDIVVNNINDPAFVFENTLYGQTPKPDQPHYLRLRLLGPPANSQGLGARIQAFHPGGTLYHDHQVCRGYLSTAEPVVHLGLGSSALVDSLRIIWPDGRTQTLRQIRADQVVTLSYQAATEVSPVRMPPTPLVREIAAGSPLIHTEEDFVDFNIQRLLPHKFSQSGPALACADVDGDGRDDFFMGGSFRHSGRICRQLPGGTFQATDLETSGNTKLQEDTGALWFDADQDGDPDLYVVSGGYERPPGDTSYQDRLYLNDGRGHMTRSRSALPAETVSGSCVKAADIDDDGDLDLFVGGRVVPGAYPKPVPAALLRNDTPRGGPPVFTDVTAAWCPALLTAGMVTDALWTDYNNDQRPDLLLVGSWMPVTVLENTGNSLLPAGDKTGIAGETGWWNCLTGGDFDADGDTDYLAGNLGLNTLYKALPGYPLTCYAGDLDQNESWEGLIGAYTRGDNGTMATYPLHTREDLIKQMIVMRRRFETFGEYGRATLDQVLTQEERDRALVFRATRMENCYIENLGQGSFRMHPLPRLAQVAPIQAFVTGDFNADGFLDAWAVGNAYDTEVLTGRYDAMRGLLLLGDGQGGFTVRRSAETGFCVAGDARSLVMLRGADGKPRWVAAQNRGPVQVFAWTNPMPGAWLIPPSAEVETSMITRPDGKQEKVEWYMGTSGLSQSVRAAWRVTSPMP